MAIVNQALEAAHLVARATITASATITTSPQTAIPSNTNNSNSNNKGGGSSSPLLFFVALGFGVVFTNLWIIVGVKYCFRYNARNRARMTNEDGEPITLENMPRPHRRRREKKLMTMDEVNDKFPMMKYKTWVSQRAREGLPTAGGVGVPSRPNSIHHADGAIPDVAAKQRTSAEVKPVQEDASPATKTEQDKELAVKGDDDKKDTTTVAETTEDGPVKPTHNLKRTTTEEEEDEEDDEEDDEQINAALPPELLNTSGDTCAICIDTLEDDDDVRGLTCGHTFHAVCVDPWLTSRRACCPLCKADYYVPKPRPNPEGDAAAAGNNANLDPRQNSRMNLPVGFPRTWFRSSGNHNDNGRHTANNDNSRAPSSLLRLPGRRRAQTAATEAQQNPAATSASEPTRPSAPVTMLSSVRHAIRFGRTVEPPPRMNATETVTPSQLESGTR
ncbi:hypothetical protein V8C26DRAFT_253603 [Trichoderma gracile]